jgi:hypothetical protein
MIANYLTTRFSKCRRPYLLLFIGCMCIGLVSTQTRMTFVHPGAVNSKADLDFVKAKIQANEQPWTTFFNQVKNLAQGGTNALTYINSNNEDSNTSKYDAKKAYANALVWYFTDIDTYAQQAIAVLNAWSGLQGFTGGNDQDKLQAGWIGALFGPAAEIMRGYSGWTAADMEDVQDMFERAFYPQLNTASSWNGNVDLTQIDAIMNIAVFNEDEVEFNLGLQRLEKRVPAYFYLASDGRIPAIDGDGGNVNNFWSNPTRWVDGLTQETCRDNNHHAQYAMASALHAVEVAWNQGVDVYTPNTKRYMAVMELMATQLLTGSMQGTCPDNITNNDLYDTWEVGFNHYHNRRGLSLPNTEKLIKEQVRIRGWSEWNIFYETLTHADIDYNTPDNDDNLNGIPADYSLEQNYPNPFNPVTTISFSIPKDGYVQLKVYDILGKEVSTLVNQEKEKGTYQIEFDAGVLANGTYFYRIIAGEFAETKKMLLMK